MAKQQAASDRVDEVECKAPWQTRLPPVHLCGRAGACGRGLGGNPPKPGVLPPKKVSGNSRPHMPARPQACCAGGVLRVEVGRGRAVRRGGIRASAELPQRTEGSQGMCGGVFL